MKYYFYYMFFFYQFIVQNVILFMQKIFDRNGYPVA